MQRLEVTSAVRHPIWVVRSQRVKYRILCKPAQRTAHHEHTLRRHCNVSSRHEVHYGQCF